MGASNKPSILIVEDNVIASFGLSAALSSIVSCDIAETGAQAVEKASQGDYALIFMDVGLPDFDGIEVTKKIRALPDDKKAEVPIVALTGHGSSQETRRACFNAGMQDVLLKPSDRSLLETVVEFFVFKKGNYKDFGEISE